MTRLDKLLAHSGFGTRKEVKQLIKAKRISVNDSYQVKESMQIDEARDVVCVDDEVISYQKVSYLMLHKPDGVISATIDANHQTVMDCIEAFVGKDMFPVGRLDIDTEGLLLICNDGKLAHQLLSPKKHVKKVYYVELAHSLSIQDIQQLETGIDLGDFTTQGAIVKGLSDCAIELTIYEGKFHQIKRMMEALDNHVVYLKRIQMGPLLLDKTLAPGEWRFLEEAEILALKNEQKEEME